MSRWFRFHADALNNPKVQRLDGDTFKCWVNILCIASQSEGQLPTVEDIAFSLRMSEEETEAIVNRLVEARLLDDSDESGLRPHNWDNRQYVSDSSAQRTKKYRDKRCDGTVTSQGRHSDGQCDGPCDVTVTPPEQNRTDTDTEQKKPSSAASAAAPEDSAPQLALVPKDPSATSAIVKPPKVDRQWTEDQHDSWYYTNYWNRTDRKASRRAYEKQILRLMAECGLTPEQAAEFLKVEAIADQHRFRDTQAWQWRQNLHPATWLNGKRWEDQPRAREPTLPPPSPQELRRADVVAGMELIDQIRRS